MAGCWVAHISPMASAVCAACRRTWRAAGLLGSTRLAHGLCSLRCLQVDMAGCWVAHVSPIASAACAACRSTWRAAG
eukprot:363280-Chlamydomonas_euryale.AAC.8